MIQNEFPKIFPRITTERLLLREITNDDTLAIFKNFSNPDIAKWFFEQPLTEIEQAIQFIDQFNSEFMQGKSITWAITLMENSKCIGTCGYGDVEYGDRGEIGFDLAKEYWGKDFMSESLIAIIDYGFFDLKLSKVKAHTYANDFRAKRLLE